MAALAASLVLTDEKLILPPRFTVDGRPENVARETRRNLGSIIDELSDEDIDAIAINAEAHRQSGQRIYLEVSYGEIAGTTDAVLQFKKSQANITAAYTFYKDEEEGQNKRLLRELKRMEYLEKVVMRQLETTDRTNSIGVVQGMLRASSAFVKNLQNIFKQVETLSKAIERGLQNKSEMPTAEQKTAAIQSIQAALTKLQPSAPTHIAIKTMVQQQVETLLKNVAMPVTALRADVKPVAAAPLTTATPKHTASTAAIVTPKAATPLSTPPHVQQVAQPRAQAIPQTTAKTTVQPVLRTNNHITPPTRMPEAAKTVIALSTTRFSVVTTPILAERLHAQISVQPLSTRAAQATAPNPIPLTIPHAATPQVQPRAPIAHTTVTNRQTALHVVAANPQLERSAPATARSAFTVIESKAGQQVLNAIARTPAANTPAPNTTVAAPVHAAVNIHTTKAEAVLPAVTARATTINSTQVTTTQPAAVQPTSAQPVVVQPVAVQPVVQQMPASPPAQVTTNQTTLQSAPQTATQPITPPTAALPTTTQDTPRANDTTPATTPQRPASKQEALRTDEPAKIEGTKSLLGKAEPEKDDKKDDKKSAFKANAKSACEACTTKDCANCGVKTSTLFGVKTNTIPVLRHVPEAMIDKAKKMFGINAGKCAGCAGGNCASCGAARVTADTAKVSSRFASLNKIAPQPTPK